ncbi:MAG: site-specific DNA-methyltransferase, partial [Gammaproteobacteria bacterium]|nr:site-specific DNA-methyltransferase [Gammaproteobacteria bacterium]
MIKQSEAKNHGIAITDSKKRFERDQEALRERLRELLPCLVNVDGHVDVKALRDVVDIANSTSHDQGYELTFAGKGLARAQADSPTNYELKTEWEQSKDFDNTSNVVIRGDNLDVLKILYQNYFRKIKMIYIDPPYNTKGENFVYKDDFRQSDANLVAQFGMNEETTDYLHNVFSTRSHSGWLAFMYPRLKLARQLLREDGVIFISIDDNE